MVQGDTVKLLKECDAGIKMGVLGINDVLARAESPRLKSRLTASRQEHIRLSRECDAMLASFGKDGKEPSPIASGMSRMKTAFKLSMHPGDHTVADLMCDGCNMGVKSLSGYLNRYEAAEERAKDIAKKLIAMEDKLATDMRDFL